LRVFAFNEFDACEISKRISLENLIPALPRSPPGRPRPGRRLAEFQHVDRPHWRQSSMGPCSTRLRGFCTVRKASSRSVSDTTTSLSPNRDPGSPEDTVTAMVSTPAIPNLLAGQSPFIPAHSTTARGRTDTSEGLGLNLFVIFAVEFEVLVARTVAQAPGLGQHIFRLLVVPRRSCRLCWCCHP
jgi:hypothetical protein